MQIKTGLKLPLASLVPNFFKIKAGIIDVDEVDGILAWLVRPAFHTRLTKSTNFAQQNSAALFLLYVMFVKVLLFFQYTYWIFLFWSIHVWRQMILGHFWPTHTYLHTYPDQILCYISLFSKIKYSLTHLSPTYLEICCHMWMLPYMKKWKLHNHTI